MLRSSIFSVPKNSQYNPKITILRMLCALFVLFVHAVFWYDYYFQAMAPLLRTINLYLFKIFQGSGETNPAVIAFLTISGYCIHRNGIRLEPIDLKTFFIRRILRVVPMLIVGTILGVGVFYALQNDPKIWAITYTNHNSWQGILYKLSGLFVFSPINFAELCYQGNGPLITCIVELWLYAAYPLLALLAITKGEKILWWFIGVVTLLGVVACTLFPSITEWWHNGSLFGFLIYWWIGVYAVNSSTKLFTFKKNYLFLYTILTVFLLINPKIFIIVELRKIVLSLIVGSTLQWCETKPWQHLYAKTFFESGYSLYAVHTPLICLALFYQFNFLSMCLAIIVIAQLCYLGIERPFVRLGKASRMTVVADQSLVW